MSDAQMRAMVPKAMRPAQELQQLLDALTSRRDAIAEADVIVAELRTTLHDFAVQHERLLQDELFDHGLVILQLRHIERWMFVLATQTLRKQDTHRLMDRLDAQRWAERQELDQLGQGKAFAQQRSEPSAALPTDINTPEGKDRLKKAFRTLARQYHPDLANDEQDRAAFGDTMARINSLYTRGDLQGLEAMAASSAKDGYFQGRSSSRHRASQQSSMAQGGSADDDLRALAAEGKVERAEVLARARLARFEAVLESLEEEQADLMACPTHLLMDAMSPRGRRTAETILAELKRKTDMQRSLRLTEIPTAMAALEACVNAYNSEQQTDIEPPVFDPYIDQEMARLSLEHLATLRPSQKVTRLVAELENIAEHQPAVARLILLTYVAQMSHRPLPGLESFEAIAERMEAAGRRDDPAMDLSEALIAADGLVDYGPRRDKDGKVVMALKFIASGIDQAVPLMLRQFTMRQLFRQVLLHLGRAVRCSPCRRTVFTVPLFRMRGLDNLRALVCPHCGTTQSSYFLPKGRDIQTVLNAAYLELDLVYEFTCTLARSTVGLQLLPIEAASMTVSGLRSRLHQEVFARHQLPVLPRQLILSQDGEPLRDGTLLTELFGRRLTVNFAPGTPVGEAAALETLRFRIRNRFRGEPAVPSGMQN